MKRFSILFQCALFILVFAFQLSAQTENLKANEKKNFSLKIGEEKNFSLSLKIGDYAEIFWDIDESSAKALNLEPKFAIFTPSGKDMSSIIKNVYDSSSIPFIAPEDGDYKLVVKFENYDEPKKSGEFKASVNYSNRFVLPAKSRIKSQRKVNGYIVKLIGVNTDDAGIGYLLIEKAGKLQYIIKADDSGVTGFHFADDLEYTYDASDKKSAALMKSTPDKTGDGTPDVAIEYYSGGAHCCYDLLFIELGDSVKPLDFLSTGDARALAISKNPKGGLRLRSGDNTFAYWLTSFAGSPIPDLILDYKEGAFRSNPEAMKKPAPTMAVLQRKATVAKKKIDLEPYTGVDNSNFLDAFWGEMLDLMYSGHQDLAWKYLDMVWDSRKQGKELFIQDFKEQLDKSKFWQMMKEDKK